MLKRTTRRMGVGGSEGFACEPLEGRAMMAADLASGAVAILPWPATHDNKLTVQHTIVNNGTTAAPGGYLVRFFLSLDTTFGPGDKLVREVNFPFTIQPGGSETYTKVIVLSKGLDSLSYRLIAKIDPLGQVPESNETNNTQVSPPVGVHFDPTIEKLDINRKKFVAGQSIRLTARNVKYMDPGVGEVRFYMDIGGDGGLGTPGAEADFIGVGTRVGNDFVITTTTQTAWLRPDARFVAWAIKSNNTWSNWATKTIEGVGGTPTVGSFGFDPTPPQLGQMVTVTAHDVTAHDPAFSIQLVRFYLDTDLNGHYNNGDAYYWNTTRVGNDWSVTLVVPDYLPTATPTKMFANALDSRGVWSQWYEFTIQPVA